MHISRFQDDFPPAIAATRPYYSSPDPVVLRQLHLQTISTISTVVMASCMTISLLWA
jgi:hypothetical protein